MRWIKRIRFNKDGVSLAADVNAAVAINEGEPGATQTVRSVSHTRVVQDSHPAAPNQTGDAEESDSDKEEHR